MQIKKRCLEFASQQSVKNFRASHFPQTSLAAQRRQLRCLIKYSQLLGYVWIKFPKDKYLKEILIIHFKTEPREFEIWQKFVWKYLNSLLRKFKGEVSEKFNIEMRSCHFRSGLSVEGNSRKFNQKSGEWQMTWTPHINVGKVRSRRNHGESYKNALPRSTNNKKQELLYRKVYHFYNQFAQLSRKDEQKLSRFPRLLALLRLRRARGTCLEETLII